MNHLRRLALLQIRKDSTLSRQYWTSSGGWVRRILRVTAWYLILPASAILIGVLVAFLGALLGSDNLAPDLAAAYTLVVAGIAAIVSFTHTGWVLRELIGSRSLAIASINPDSDRSYVTSRLALSLQKSLLFLAGSLLLGGGIAFGAEQNVLETVQVLLLSVLLWAMVASLSVIIPAFFPGLVRQESVSFVVSVAMMLFFTGVVLVSLGIARQGTLIFAVLATLPTGWPILMIKYGVILEQPEYWRLLIPAGSVVIFATYSWYRLLARYRILEFSYEPGSIAIAEFDLAQNTTTADEQASPQSHSATLKDSSDQPQPTNSASWLQDRKRRLRKWLKFADADESSAELSRDEAIARIRESGLTKSFAWSESRFIERGMEKILGDDELLAADILTCGEPKWSVAMTRSLIPASAAVMLVVLAALIIDRKVAVISGHVALGGLIGTFAGSRLAAQWRSGSGEMCSALAILPINERHVSRMLMTLGAIRSLLIFPLAVGVVMTITWGHSGRWEVVDSAIFGGKSVLVLFMIHQWWILIMQPFSHSKSIVKSIMDIFAAFLIVSGMIAGVFLLLTSGRSETWSMVGAGLMFGGGWIVQKIQRRRVLTSPTDFALQIQNQRVAAQRQQQNKRTRRVPTFWPRPVDQPELSS